MQISNLAAAKKWRDLFNPTCSMILKTAQQETILATEDWAKGKALYA